MQPRCVKVYNDCIYVAHMLHIHEESACMLLYQLGATPKPVHVCIQPPKLTRCDAGLHSGFANCVGIVIL